MEVFESLQAFVQMALATSKSWRHDKLGLASGGGGGLWNHLLGAGGCSREAGVVLFFFRFLGLHNTIPSSPKSQRCNFRLGHLFFGFFFLLLQWKKTDVVTVGFVSQDKWFTPTQIVWVSDVTTNGPGKKEEINNQSLIINNELIINSHFSTYII